MSWNYVLLAILSSFVYSKFSQFISLSACFYSFTFEIHDHYSEPFHIFYSVYMEAFFFYCSCFVLLWVCVVIYLPSLWASFLLSWQLLYWLSGNVNSHRCYYKGDGLHEGWYSYCCQTFIYFSWILLQLLTWLETTAAAVISTVQWLDCSQPCVSSEPSFGWWANWLQRVFWDRSDPLVFLHDYIYPSKHKMFKNIPIPKLKI